MNEGDSAGGHIGRSPAPPAVTDRRSNTSGSVQVSCFKLFIQKIVILSGFNSFFSIKLFKTSYLNNCLFVAQLKLFKKIKTRLDFLLY